ncbi:MAG: 16S rRNA (guanine(966)-N(2))-methyltransferase RsmD [Gammaproteobacteria bacterium]|nr:16S rRNA (guanine(966)-N(2))-methyltransferase RsmD [Gammaproteobacteria bacterium]
MVQIKIGKRVANNSLRIIGGTWRSRRLQFIDSPKIRPTPDRVRETLFNWLANDIKGSICLDLFAGSGALGFEAMSRGADRVMLVEEDARIAAMLSEQKELFDAQEIEIKNQNALTYLPNANQQYDLIFLDPPFCSDLLEKVIPIILKQKLLNANGLIYVESAAQQKTIQSLEILLETLYCIREKVSGEVRYALYKGDAQS